MTTVSGLEINATFARAVGGGDTLPPVPLVLDPTGAPLPTALGLQQRKPEVGAAGRKLCRQLPHLACDVFLPDLGTARTWVVGRHRFDAARALGLVCDTVRPAFAGSDGVVITAPGYLDRAQLKLVNQVAEKSKLPVLAVVSAPLALTRAAWDLKPWAGAALVIDADEHALTLALVETVDGQAVCAGSQAVTKLGLRAWKSRLLDVICDRCVRHSRRDPRDSAVAEQHLYDQFDVAMEASRQGRMVELDIQTANWYQNVIVRPDEIIDYGSPLANETLDAIAGFRDEVAGIAPAADKIGAVVVSAAVEVLPGLMPTLQESFGLPRTFTALKPDGVAESAHALAQRVIRAVARRGLYDESLPLPAANPADVAPRPFRDAPRLKLRESGA